MSDTKSECSTSTTLAGIRLSGDIDIEIHELAKWSITCFDHSLERVSDGAAGDMCYTAEE